MLKAYRTLSESFTIADVVQAARVYVRGLFEFLTVFDGRYQLAIHIPLYIYPTHWIAGSEWYQLRDIIAAYPDVQFIAKINVNSGPDTALNTDYVAGIGILNTGSNADHLKIIGYVYTSYGARLIADVKTDIDRWQTVLWF